MEKYIIASPGRAASNTLQNHISNSLHKLHIPNHVEALDMPMLWPEIVEDPENWNVVISTRRDMLAQVISFCSIVLTKLTHVTGKRGNQSSDVSIENFVIPRIYFFTFAHGILFFHERVFPFNGWSKFKKVHWLVYEDIIKDWNATGKQLGFDDWSSESEGHALGHGPIWDKVINKEQVLEWVKELQKNHEFTTDLEKYKL